MSSLSRELVFLILQFLDEEKFKETVHKLEQESGFFFNMKHFEDEEITQLLTLENFRDNEQLSKYGDTRSARAVMLVELKKLIEANPLFRDKLQFPNLKNSRLRTLINQSLVEGTNTFYICSLNWQHQLCKSPKPNLDIKTLFVDHSCGQPNGASTPSQSNNPLLGGAVPKPGGFPPLAAHVPFQPMPGPVPTPLASWMSNPPAGTHPAVSGGPLLGSPPIPAGFKYPRTPPTNSSIDFLSGDSDHVNRRTRPLGISDEGSQGSLPVNIQPLSFPGIAQSHTFSALEDFPKSVAWTFNQASSPMSMDFHPAQQTLLLVGTNVGDIGLWEVGSRERLMLRNFKVWDLSNCSMTFQASVAKDPAVSINRVLWSPDGSLFGVAYSRHIVQIYSYHGKNDVRQHLEIDAHVGAVNDLAFSHPNKQLSVITCGDDKLIKVWDATTGAKQYNFEGHEAPVYSVCPHNKDNIQFIFSTALDGKIKAWLYDNLGSRVDYDAPGRWCTTLAYSADGKRLFSCGTSKEGESHIVEWNESEGAVKRIYQGFRKRSLGVVQFDTAKNRFLAAGDDFSIKIWDMDNTQLLTFIDTDGGLPASPRIRFSKNGTLLAVSANDNGIKILANTDGFRILRASENLAFDASRTSEGAKPAVNPISTAVTSSMDDRVASAMNRNTRDHGDVKPRIAAEDASDKLKNWKLSEINEPSQCRSSKLPEHSKVTKISRLTYTNSGSAILALASNAIHLLWKWPRSDPNFSGKATASVSPQLWQPSSGILMTNDMPDMNPEEAVPCFALSKNDSYVMSASGGKISLFNMMTFKTMTTFMSPPPAATSLAFHPQDNNIIAIGMDDSSIQIFNVRVDEVKSKLKGHSKRITGLAFSNTLNVLVSSGADAQVDNFCCNAVADRMHDFVLCVWSSVGWEMQKSRSLQLPPRRSPEAPSETRVQFHHDQTHFLVIHETQLAIYETTKLDCIHQWVPPESAAPISHAMFSCDSQLVYASLVDATICIFNASHLRLRCRISRSAYLPSSVSSSIHPMVIAAHPQEVNQFALGLSDGSVHVIEPHASEAKWGVPPPPENGSTSNAPVTPSVGASTSDQPQR
ncbi:hypothetical protein SASPL_118038 [Salvia splendens]|uniref:Uncharacterized protein n=1 Tax=Salvia splendens TaxID=180675 RepID=A0A8X8XW02_SALSN|nr:hypothetical protein SASPL_118038 [Salvia splendens]